MTNIIKNIMNKFSSRPVIMDTGWESLARRCALMTEAEKEIRFQTKRLFEANAEMEELQAALKRLPEDEAAARKAVDDAAWAAYRRANRAQEALDRANDNLEKARMS
jgi:hypothetical protein